MGESLAYANWGEPNEAAQNNTTANEEFRRQEIEAMNQQARVIDSLAVSGPGMSEEDYWNQPANTVADRYADTYGGRVIQPSGGNYGEAASPYGQGWTDADGTKWLPEVTVTTNRNDGTYAIGNDGYGAWHATAKPDNAPLQVMGESTDGGLIRNTDAVSYPVSTPDIEVRPVTGAAAMESIRPIGAVEGFLTFNPLGRTIMGVGKSLNNAAEGFKKLKLLRRK